MPEAAAAARSSPSRTEVLVPETTFTDDSVMTVATAAALLGDGDYATAYRDFGNRYPGRGYGSAFQRWLRAWDMGAYGSFGNGSAMRVSPVGYAADSVAAVLAEAKRSGARKCLFLRPSLNSGYGRWGFHRAAPRGVHPARGGPPKPSLL